MLDSTAKGILVQGSQKVLDANFGELLTSEPIRRLA